MLETSKSIVELTKAIDVLEALFFIKQAWQEVSSAAIKNCLKKAGFKKSHNHEAGEEFDPGDDLPLSEMQQNWYDSGADIK